jgi:hypothetical protein
MLLVVSRLTPHTRRTKRIAALLALLVAALVAAAQVLYASRAQQAPRPLRSRAARPSP